MIAQMMFGLQRYRSWVCLLDHSIKYLLRKITGPKNKVGRALTWKFDKDDADELLKRMESLKTLIHISLEMDHSKLSQAIKENIDSFGTSIRLQLDDIAQVLKDTKAAHEQIRVNNDLDGLRQWLSPCQPAVAHSRSCKRHHPGTNSWFVDNYLIGLLNGGSSGLERVILLKGPSGTGKTTIRSQAIEALAEDGRSATFYFYCSFDDVTTQDPLSIAAAWLVQASIQTQTLLEELLSDFLKSKQRSAPPQFSIQLLEELLAQHFSTLNRVFLCIDAINESKQSASVVDLIFRLARSCNNLTTIVTSTSDLGEPGAPAEKFDISTVSMEQGRMEKDITTYVADITKSHQAFRTASQELREEIIAMITDRLEGTFRYAPWLVDHLTSQKTGRAMRLALQEMPHNLNETYEMLLDRAPKGSSDRASTSFYFVGFSRPWIQSNRRQKLRFCLSYLSLREFESGYDVSDQVLHARFRRYPLLKYMVHNWTWHIQDLGRGFWEAVKPFLDSHSQPGGGYFGWWLRCLGALRECHRIRHDPPLYYVASYSLLNLMEVMLQFDPEIDIEARGGRVGSTALQVAAFRKQFSTTTSLLHSGADAFSLDGSGIGGGFSACF
ncbi:hypothetical protein BDV96DRAFT_597860 [Lophiotrema nucula]|uniref:Nephrocystin 3-like N-terminal domain-containing protein n=1 Tax=Lophiotrema nucula TaxID=690887 RepID=A0A6A5ZGX0_9PLEO|nr:hypothetical protein BDV96DRAFT_597860 [Lophiotrema nucula]